MSRVRRYQHTEGIFLQVKLRGFRIELGEVEAAMADVPGVALAAALVLKDASGSPQLVGYVTPDSVDPAAVLSSLRARLPAHFVPLLVVPLREMPLSPSGKVDRRALESQPAYRPDWTAAAMSDEYVAPRSPVEAAVQAAWQEVLGMQRVSVESEFFRIGGNSLMANKVTSRLRAALGVPLSGGALYQHPTIASLAAQLQAAGAGQAQANGVRGIVPVAGYDKAALAAGVPASSQQEQVLRGDRDGLTYMEELLRVRLVGALDAGALARAWDALAMRHATLRTRFRDDGDRLLQVHNTSRHHASSLLVCSTCTGLHKAAQIVSAIVYNDM